MKYAFIICLILTYITAESQPWLFESYRQSSNPDIELTISEKISAFDNYWKNRQVEKGKGFMAFSRWKDFVEIRSAGMDKLPSDIFFTEWQKQLKDKSVSGSWSYIGADETPLQIASGERSGSGRINAIEFHPTDQNIIYIGAPAGGLWKTTNGGVTWETATDRLPSIGISDIAINPHNPDEIFIATGDADASDTYTCGLLKSADAGQTWQTTGYNPLIASNQNLNKVIINPINPDSILIATNSSIRLSVNGGDNFSIMKTGNFRDIKYKPGNPSVVYASSYLYYGSAKVWRSEDGGVNWTDISPPAEEMDSVSRIAIGVTSINPEIVYLLTAKASDNGFYALYRSSDGGNTWVNKFNYTNKNLLGWESDGSDNGGQGWYDLGLAVSPLSENIVIVGGVNLWRSTNGGTSFNIIGHWYGDMTHYVHADQHITKYQPGSNYLFAGNDGGLYKSQFDGDEWLDLSDGLHIMQIYRIGVALFGSDMIVSGTQDNGTMLKMDYLWNNILGGDGMDCMIDFSEPGTFYGEYYYGNLYRTYNTGYSWDPIKPQQAQDGSWITPLAMDPTNSNTIYAGYEDVYISTDQGYSWSPISSNLLDSATINILEIAPSDHDIIVAGIRDKLMKTTDGGSTWTDIYTAAFNDQLASVCFSPTDPDKMWASISGYVASKKVYYSDDGGLTWTGFATGLPNVPVNCLAYEPSSPDRIYAGTDLGVYVKDTVLSSWIPFYSGLPNTVVNDLVISQNQIIAATYGRGLWVSDLLTEYPQNADLNSFALICKAYPIPANDHISVSLPLSANEKFTLSLSSPDGKIIINEKFTGSNYRLEIPEISNGIYILSVEGEKGRYVTKIQIIK